MDWSSENNSTSTFHSVEHINFVINHICFSAGFYYMILSLYLARCSLYCYSLLISKALKESRYVDGTDQFKIAVH